MLRQLASHLETGSSTTSQDLSRRSVSLRAGTIEARRIEIHVRWLSHHPLAFLHISIGGCISGLE